MTTEVSALPTRTASPPRVLVTGGPGFIGRRVVRALPDDGAQVTVADKREFPGADRDEVRTVIGDLCDPSVVAEAVRRCSLRFTSVYGPGMQEKDSFVPRLMRAARDGTGVEVYGDGTQVRDLVHVDDIVAGMFAAYQAGYSGPVILGAGESVSVNDVVDAARGVTGFGIPVRHVPPKRGETPAVIVGISAARAPGYAPSHDLKSGLATVWPEFSEAAK